MTFSSFFCCTTEVEVELDADAASIGAGVVTVVEAPNVVHAQDGQDVVKADASFHIGFVAHRLAKCIGREKEHVARGRRVVLVAEASPEAAQ